MHVPNVQAGWQLQQLHAMDAISLHYLHWRWCEPVTAPESLNNVQTLQTNTIGLIATLDILDILDIFTAVNLHEMFNDIGGGQKEALVAWAKSGTPCTYSVCKALRDVPGCLQMEF